MNEQDLTALANLVGYEGSFHRLTPIEQLALAEDYISLLAERDAAVKSATFQRQRADRGWFLYERTLTELINFRESRPENDRDWDELRQELQVCEAERDALKAQLRQERIEHDHLKVDWLDMHAKAKAKK